MMRETGVYLADEQAQRLASLARQEGRSRAEILRAAIVAYQPTGRNDRSFALADGFARVDRVHSRSLRSPSRSCGGVSALDLIVDAAPLVARAQEVTAKGYRAFKAVFIPYTHYHAPLPDVDKVARMMAALRDAVGPEVEVMVDFHGRPASAAAALAYIEALAPARPMFVEEPVPPGELAALRAVAERTRVPLATGERLVDRAEFNDLLQARAIDIVQPDICHCGGLLEAKKIAAMAEAVSVGVAPHNPLGPIAGVAALHFAVATPNHVIQEEMVGAVPWYDAVVRGPIHMIDGYWQIPEGPGLGVEVDERICEAHPYLPEIQHATNAVLSDGTVVDW